MVFRTLVRGFAGAVGRAYGTGFANRMQARFGGRRVSGKPSSFRGRRVMRAVGFNTTRRRRGSMRPGRPEKHKRLVFNSAATTITHSAGSPTFVHLTDIDQGLVNTNRIGDIIVGKRLYGKLRFTWVAAEVTVVQSTFRIMFIQMKSRIASAPILSEFLESTAAGVGTISLFQLKKEMDADERYKVLLDRYFTLSKFQTAVASGVNGSGQNSKTMRINIKMNSRIQYLDATGSNFGRGMIFMVVFSDVVMANDPVMSGQLRFTYVDV